MSKISNERLVEMLQMIAAPAEGLSIGMPSLDLHAALTELQSLRSQPAGVRGTGRADLLVQLARIIARNVDEERFYDAPGFQRAADEILSTLEPQQEEAVATIWQARNAAGAWVNCTDRATAHYVAKPHGGETRPLYAHPTSVQKVQESPPLHKEGEAAKHSDECGCGYCT